MKRLAIALLLIGVSSSYAETSGHHAVTVFTAPEAKEPKIPQFPNRAARDAAEAWVVYSFMVDIEGKVYEPTLIESTGGRFGRDFEKEAKRALERTDFHPAMNGSTPVEGASTMKYIFRMKSGADGATKIFSRQYSQFSKILASNDQQATQASLRKLEDRGVRNLYENAYLNMARFNYAVKYGTTAEQMKYLNTALSYENIGPKVSFLPDDMVVIARRKLFELQLANKFYAEAAKSYEAFGENEDTTAVELLMPSYQELTELKSNEDAFELDAVTNENGFWSINLFKQGFAITEADGVLDEVKLRCAKKYVFFPVELDEEYSIPASFGDCNLQLLGNADVDFKLVQF